MAGARDLMSKIHLPGHMDGRTSKRGPGYTERLSWARTAMWAHVADADQEAEDMAAWHSKRPRPVHISGTWAALPKARREKYLDGGRAPHRSLVEGVALASPASLDVYESRLWTALRSDTDLATCQILLRSLGGMERLRSLEMVLLEGDLQKLSGSLMEWNTAALLVAAIRLAMYDGDKKGAFQYGRLLTQVISYLGLLSRYRGGIERLWDLVSRGVLAGLSDGSYLYAERVDVLVAFSQVLSDRKADLQYLCGGTRRMAASCDFQMSTLIDAFHFYVTAFSTPGAEAHDSLISMIEASEWLHPVQSQAVSVLRDRRLFEPLPA